MFVLSHPGHFEFPKSHVPSMPVALALAMVIMVLTASCTSQQSADSEPTPVITGAPNTTFPMPPIKADSEMGWVMADNKRERLIDYRGKILVLDFYATWCAPCRESIPDLMSLQQRLGSKGVQVVGLNVGGPDDRVKVAEFARELRIQYPLGFPDRTLTDLFLSDDQTIPQTFVFGREGQLVKRFIGYQKDTGAELEKTIEAELQ
jgi:thiol-disulfide isomerase/thioredoxin